MFLCQPDWKSASARFSICSERDRNNNIERGEDIVVPCSLFINGWRCLISKGTSIETKYSIVPSWPRFLRPGTASVPAVLPISSLMTISWRPKYTFKHHFHLHNTEVGPQNNHGRSFFCNTTLPNRGAELKVSDKSTRSRLGKVCWSMKVSFAECGKLLRGKLIRRNNFTVSGTYSLTNWYRSEIVWDSLNLPINLHHFALV